MIQVQSTWFPLVDRNPQKFVPNIFELAYGTLNLTVTQNLTKWLKFQFQAKNLTNPAIETVYRSEYTGGDLLHTSYTKGIELTIGLNASFVF